MRMALVRDGRVENIIEAEPGFDPGEGASLLPSLVADVGWRREGKELLPPAPDVPAAPAAVSDLAFRLALNRLGLREPIEEYVASATQDVRDWWDRAITIERDNAMVREGLRALGRDESELGIVFALAATITA